VTVVAHNKPTDLNLHGLNVCMFTHTIHSENKTVGVYVNMTTIVKMHAFRKHCDVVEDTLVLYTTKREAL
jgi:hypothetical protein